MSMRSVAQKIQIKLVDLFGSQLKWFEKKGKEKRQQVDLLSEFVVD